MAVNIYKQKAFTLVEMAIVMVIIGILVSGVVTGIKVYQNARVTATVVQIQNYSAAVKSFEKIYKGLPGDLKNAHKKIRGCQGAVGFAGCKLVPGGGSYITKQCENMITNDCEERLEDDCDEKMADDLVICTGKVGEGDTVCSNNVLLGNERCNLDGSGLLASAAQVASCESMSPPNNTFFPSVAACLAMFSKTYGDQDTCLGTEVDEVGNALYIDEVECKDELNYYADNTACMLVEAEYADSATCQTALEFTGDYAVEVVKQKEVTGIMGDGMIGPVSWDMYTFRGSSVTDIDPGNAVDAETVLFWYELMKAGLISGVTDAGLKGAAKARFGETLPAAEAGGGFWAGYSDGRSGGGIGISGSDSVNTGRPGSLGGFSMIGNVLTLVKIPTGGKILETIVASEGWFTGYSLIQEADTQMFKPAQAVFIDRKLDDGLPATGIVQPFGLKASCYSTVLPPNFTYDESVGNRDCGLYVLIK